MRRTVDNGPCVSREWVNSVGLRSMPERPTTFVKGVVPQGSPGLARVGTGR